MTCQRLKGRDQEPTDPQRIVSRFKPDLNWIHFFLGFNESRDSFSKDYFCPVKWQQETNNGDGELFP